jgi:hypothetical protein
MSGRGISRRLLRERGMNPGRSVEGSDPLPLHHEPFRLVGRARPLVAPNRRAAGPAVRPYPVHGFKAQIVSAKPLFIPLPFITLPSTGPSPAS